MMKRYLAFLFDQYAPNGGMEDCIGYFDTINEAKDAIASGLGLHFSFDEIYCLGHIFCNQAMKNVLYFKNGDDGISWSESP